MLPVVIELETVDVSKVGGSEGTAVNLNNWNEQENRQRSILNVCSEMWQ